MRHLSHNRITAAPEAEWQATCPAISAARLSLQLYDAVSGVSRKRPPLPNESLTTAVYLRDEAGDGIAVSCTTAPRGNSVAQALIGRSEARRPSFSTSAFKVNKDRPVAGASASELPRGTTRLSRIKDAGRNRSPGTRLSKRGSGSSPPPIAAAAAATDTVSVHATAMVGRTASLLLLLTIALCLAGGGDCLTGADVSLLRAALRSTILNVTARDGYGLPFRPLVGAFVRLAFLACVGDRCSGCIDVAYPGNANLDAPIRVLSELRRRLDIAVSYGDLFALAGIVALNVGEEIAATRAGSRSNNITHSIRFRQGRLDCPTAPYANHRSGVDFPSSAGGLDHVISWFQLNFGFRAEQTVAVMGLHKLGGLKRRNDTLELFAQWSFAPDALDNGYYQDLVRIGDWRADYARTPPASADRTHLWRRQAAPSAAFMFNCDVALYKNIEFRGGRGNTAGAACGYEACPLSKTSSIAVAFAHDNDLWLRTMSDAYSALVEKGY